MNKLKFYILGCLISVAILGCEPLCKLNDSEITNMYSSYVEEWKKQVSLSIDEAEKEVFKKPSPLPDNPRPDPDPAKCICRGTGIIVHGDGHKTLCEFHGKKGIRQ